MLDKNLLSDYINTALDAAEQASAAILEVYRNAVSEVELKSDSSPLTLADKRAHEAINKALEKTGLPVLSEEGRSIPYSRRKGWDLFWLVDPLDGTKEFIKRNGEFTVNIALIRNGKPVWGVVQAPVLNKCYFLDEEGVAWLKENERKVQLKSCVSIPRSRSGLRIVASRSHTSEETSKFIESLNNPVLVSMGSSLKFMMLAEGSADIYPRFAPTMEWDTAAAHAILNALGYKVRDGFRKLELEYNKENLVNPFFVAGCDEAMD